MRETGFRSFFREMAPEFELLDTLVNLETRQLTYEAMVGLLDRHHDITAIYVVGGGMEGAIKAVEESQRSRDIILAVNENTPVVREAMQNGVVSFANLTPTDKLVTTAIDTMIKSIQFGQNDIPGQIFLRHELLIPEML